MKRIIVLLLTFCVAITALGVLVFNVPYDTAESPEELASLINLSGITNLKYGCDNPELLRQLDGVGIVCEIRQQSTDTSVYGVEIERPTLVSKIKTLMKSACDTAGIKTLEGDEWKNSNTKSILIMTVMLDPRKGQIEKLYQERTGEYREDTDKWDVWVHLKLMEQYILKRNQQYTVYDLTWSKLESFKSKETLIDGLAIETSQLLLRQFVSDYLAANSSAAVLQEQSTRANK